MRADPVSVTDRTFVHAAVADRTAGSREATLYRAAKRLFDVAFAVAVLVATGPVILVAALAVRLDSPGPAFFRQPRMGRGGNHFSLLKLRGMYVDARERFPDAYDYGAIEAQELDSYRFHQAADPRVTRVGRVIRRCSVDELPNFWNVLRGDMSVVGPRPEIPQLAHLYGHDLKRFLSVKPGVTSPAKANGRSELSFAETLDLELDYVNAPSFGRDFVTILQTAASLLRPDGRGR